MTRNLELYLSLERLMLGLDEAGDPMADEIRDLMDPVWHRLTPAEVVLLDARGQIDPASLFPVRLPAPPPGKVESATIVGQTVENSDVGWRASDDWKVAA